MTEKPSNPKDSCGIRKAPLSTLPAAVLLEAGVAMLEGARKYGRHNYREVGVRASVYYDAATRHLIQFWDLGEDTDKESGAQISHVTKAIVSLMVLRDSMLRGNWIDDRPPALDPKLLASFNEMAGAVIDKFPEPKPAVTHIGLMEKLKGLVPVLLVGLAIGLAGCSSKGEDAPLALAVKDQPKVRVQPLPGNLAADCYIPPKPVLKADARAELSKNRSALKKCAREKKAVVVYSNGVFRTINAQ